MKKIATLLCILFCLQFGFTASAQQYSTALGVRLSSKDAIVNNSITLKHFFGNAIALEGLLSFGDPVALGFLIEKHRFIGAGGLSWFYGGGAYVGFSEDKNVGMQGVLGLDCKIRDVPLNFSLDWKPELNIVQKTTFEPAALGVSIRFTFN